MKLFQRINKVFLGTVVLPTLTAVIYYSLIASDVYISESRFVVRSQEDQSSSPLLGLILKGTGFKSSTNDSYTVQDYMLSRDALQSLVDELHIKDIFSDSSIDIFRRFPGFLDWDNSFENFHDYYQKIIDVKLDSVSSISTLTTHAFSGDTAWQMNNRLLELAENLINRLNERGREDLIRFSIQEVADAEIKAKTAALALANYRNEKGVIDPERQSAVPLQQVAKLQDELIATKTQIAQLQKLTKDNPQLPVLYQLAHLLENEIHAETNRIAGGGERSLAGKAAGYQRLVLEKEFADKMLASAMSSLEQARNEAQRKQLYLERIAQPSKPDSAMEPRRVRIITTVFILGIITWGVLSLLLASIQEHVD